MQIRTRLTLTFILVVATILIASLYFVYSNYEDLIIRDSYSQLKIKATNQLEKLFSDSIIQDIPKVGQAKASNIKIDQTLAVYDENYKLLFSINNEETKNDFTALSQVAHNKEYCSFEDAQVTAIFKYRNRSKDYYVMAKNVFDMSSLTSVRNILIWSFLIAIICVALAGFAFTQIAMKPIKSIITQVESFEPNNLDKRIKETKTNDEIGQMEKAFNQLLNRIQEAFIVQKNFISNVSHELKNPITLITSQLEVLIGGNKDLPPSVKDTIKSTLQDSYRLSELTDNLLLLAKINSDANSLSFSRVALDELMFESKAYLLKIHPNYTINLHFNGNPTSNNELYIDANEALLRSAFVNIMDNCCKYSPNKKVEVALYFTNENKKYIEFIDDGPGIKESDIPLLFKPFYRDPKAKHIKGSGIGLSLVNSVIKHHSFQVQVSSKPNEGTTFKINLYTAN